MTEYERIRLACTKALVIVRNSAPIDTGNLRSSIKILYRPGDITIYINGADGSTRGTAARGMAPYAKYTNEPWSQFKPPLRGKQNPNEGWFDAAAIDAAFAIAKLLGGEVVRR